jgi:hypothetical protein
MREADAKEYVTQNDPDWVMPEEWWQIEVDELSFHVSDEEIKYITGEDVRFQRTHPDDIMLVQLHDIYGAICQINPSRIQAIFRTTKLCRAKWIVGLSERNYKEDDPPGDDEWNRG